MYTFFLWSKYWEWLDTLFLHLSGKPISQLQYTHHMSTAMLVYYKTTKVSMIALIVSSLSSFGNVIDNLSSDKVKMDLIDMVYDINEFNNFT